MGEKAWVDFNAVKAAVTMQMVLDHYEVKGLRRVGDELRGRCPVHKGPAKSTHLNVNSKKNAFKCFSSNCGARGNVLDFVAAMEKCSVKEAALKLQDWFKVGETHPSEPQQLEKETGVEVQRGIYQDPSGGRYEVIATAVRLDDLLELVVFRELFDEFQFWAASPETFDQNSINEASDSHRRFTLIKAL